MIVIVICLRLEVEPLVATTVAGRAAVLAQKGIMGATLLAHCVGVMAVLGVAVTILRVLRMMVSTLSGMQGAGEAVEIGLHQGGCLGHTHRFRSTAEAARRTGIAEHGLVRAVIVVILGDGVGVTHEGRDGREMVLVSCGVAIVVGLALCGLGGRIKTLKLFAQRSAFQPSANIG